MGDSLRELGEHLRRAHKAWRDAQDKKDRARAARNYNRLLEEIGTLTGRVWDERSYLSP